MQFKKITTLVLGGVLFLLGGLIGLYLFISESIVMIEDIRQRAPLVVIPKGAFYMFGGGVGILAISYALTHDLIVKKPSKRYLKIWGSVFFGSFFLMFTLPHLIHYPLANELRKMGYTYCAEKSHYWLHNSNIAFVSDSALCVADKTSRRNELDKSGPLIQSDEQIK